MILNKFSAYTLSFFFFVLMSLTACEPGEKNPSDALPTARGASGELLLVMDSASWQGELGDEIRVTFMKAMPGLPQPEPYFSVKYVDPLKLNKVLRNAKNMLFVATLDNESTAGRKMRSYFTDASIERIQSDPDLFQFGKKDLFAKGQQVLFLFGTSDEELIQNMRESREAVRSHFHTIEIDRIQKNLYQANEKRAVNQNLLKDKGFYLRVPYEYEPVPLDHDPEKFTWLRSLDNEVDKSIVVAHEDYTTEDVFTPEGIKDLRRRVMRSNIRDDSTTYMTVQDLVPIEIDTINFNGKFAVEARGLWKMSNNSMGGPFLGYAFVDEESGRLYYIEGFVYSPGKQKRPFIREVEAILKTFKTPEEVNVSKATS